jgi:hypothetical protein
MEIKKYPDRADLISEWLRKYPNDVDHPDLIQMATAGLFETHHGFMTPDEYKIYSGWVEGRWATETPQVPGQR